MSFAKLSEDYWKNEKIHNLRVENPQALVAWTILLSYCACLENNGRFTKFEAQRTCLINNEEFETLENKHFIDHDEGDYYCLHNFDKYQNVADDKADERHQLFVDAGRRGAMKRWHGVEA